MRFWSCGEQVSPHCTPLHSFGMLIAMKPLIAAIVVNGLGTAALLGLVCCEERKEAPAAAPPAAPARPAVNSLDLQPTHARPEVTLEIVKSDDEPPHYTVNWTARVDSTGWKMTTDTVLVEEVIDGTVARVYTIVHEPQPGDTVTSTPETLTLSYDAGTRKVDKAELSLKHTVRDSKPTYPQMYAVAKYAMLQ